MSHTGARPKEKHITGYNRGDHMETQNVETKRQTQEESIGFYRHLSVRLYDVLGCVGASTEFRNLRQDCSILEEIIHTIRCGLRPSKQSCFIFGRYSEGTTTPGLNSDTDIFYCLGVPVVDNISKTGGGQSMLMIHEIHTPPGYVKLQLVYNRHPLTVYTRYIDYANFKFDSEGRTCLKHISVFGHTMDINERNGPADTNTDFNMDFVNGSRCPTIPEFAREWIGRDRQYKWPSKFLLEKMVAMGCFVVGVGHPASEERNIEWRLSFSLQKGL